MIKAVILVTGTNEMQRHGKLMDIWEVNRSDFETWEEALEWAKKETRYSNYKDYIYWVEGREHEDEDGEYTDPKYYEELKEW